MKFYFALLLTLFCFSGKHSFSQEKLSRSYTVKDGLASNTVYKILIDKKGFLWFATDAGVSMFDGTVFTNFSARDGLADNDVLGLFEDNEDRIWFLCFNQQPCYYYKGKFCNAGNTPELAKIKNYNWHVVLVDDNEVWFAGKDHIYKFSNNKIASFVMPEANTLLLLTKIGSSIYALKDSIFLIYNRNAGRFDVCPDISLRLSVNERLVNIGDGKVVSIEQPNAKLTTLYKIAIDPGSHKVTKLLYCKFDKEAITCTYDSKINALRTSFVDNTVVEQNFDSNSKPSIIYKLNSYVSDVAVDGQGNKWFTLLRNGIEMHPQSQSYNITTIPAIKTQHSFCSIVNVNDQIIAGNSNNMLFSIINGKLEAIIGDNFSSQNNRVLDMKMDSHGQLWLGTDNDVYTYDIVSNKLTAKNTGTSIKDIKYDAMNDAMLFASSNGSFFIPCNKNSQQLFLNRERTTCIAGSLSDTCWFATLNGLYFYDGKTPKKEATFSSELNSRVVCLEADKQKRLWLGTSSNGVFVVQHNKVIFHFTKEKGITSDICKNIYIDADNAAWISTNLGVSLIKTVNDSFTITKYNDKNCLIDNNVNDILVLKDTVYVLSGMGISFFNKNKISSNYNFPIYITKVKIGGNEITVEDSLVLKSSQNTLSISFSGLSYLSNGEITYEYYISEFSREPQFTPNNSVTFSQLSPGVYNFYVRAKDVFGNKSKGYAHITFTIVPQWYQLIWLRWLVSIGCVIIVVIITFKYSKKHEKRKRLQSEINQTISRLELEAIHSQINPHFIFNCLNAIQSAIYKNNNESASYFINRFAKLMRQALMLSKESFISIEEEYNFVNNYLEVEKLRHNGSFDYAIEVDEQLNKSTPCVPAFVLQPFIENAINHGIKYLKDEKGLITVKFIRGDQLMIELDDNGIGIKASREINKNSSSMHSSKGVELILARIKSLNEIYDKNIRLKMTDKNDLDKAQRGTRVIISLDIL